MEKLLAYLSPYLRNEGRKSGRFSYFSLLPLLRTQNATRGILHYVILFHIWTAYLQTNNLVHKTFKSDER